MIFSRLLLIQRSASRRLSRSTNTYSARDPGSLLMTSDRARELATLECGEPGPCEARESADRPGAHSVGVRIGGARLTVGGGVSQREG